jgi:hypothetical protein
MIIPIDDLENILKLHSDQFGSIILSHTYIGNILYIEYIEIGNGYNKLIMYYNIYLSNGNLERYTIQFYYDDTLSLNIELTYVMPKVKSIILDILNRSYKIQNILSV